MYDVKTGMAYDIHDLDLSSFNQLFLIDTVQTPSGVQHRFTQVQLATGSAIATPDTPPPDTTTTTTEKPSLTNIPVAVTSEKPAAPTTDNIPSPHAGEVHVLKMIVEDVDFDDVKVKKEPCSDDDNIRKHDGQLKQNDYEKHDREDQVSGQHDDEEENKPDEGKDKDDSIVTDADKQANEEKKVDVDENQVSGEHDGEEDLLIENEENKPDDEKEKDDIFVCD